MPELAAPDPALKLTDFDSRLDNWSTFETFEIDRPDSMSQKRWVEYENRRTCILVTNFRTKPCHLDTNIDHRSTFS